MDFYHPTGLACRLRQATGLVLGLFLLADATWHTASAKQTSLSAEAATAGPTPTAATEQPVTAASDSADMSAAQNTEPASSRVNTEAGQTLDKSRQDGSETLNTRDCLPTLKHIREQLEEVSTEVEELKKKLIATKEEVATLSEKCSKQAAQLDDELKSLRQKNAELEARAARQPPQQPTGSLGDRRVWIVGGLAFLAGGCLGCLLTTLLRQQRPEVTAGRKRKPALETPRPFTKRIDLALRSPAADWPEFRALVDTDWRDLPDGAAWNSAWAEMAREAMQQALRSADQPAGRRAAADFAGNVWARFVSQFDPDHNSWTWTDEQCRRALPEELRLELGTVRPNEPYNQHVSVITQASGEGQFVADVHFPGCRVRGTDGRTLHESGAVVVKGDRL